MVLSGSGSQLPAPATGYKVHQSLEVVKRSFQFSSSRSIKLRGED